MIQPHFLIDSIGRLLLPMLDATIKGTLLLIVACAVCVVLRRDSAATRHLVWATAVLLLLAMPLLSILLPQWRVLPHWLQAGLDLKLLSRSSPDLVAMARHSPQARRFAQFPEDDTGDPMPTGQPLRSVPLLGEQPPASSGESNINNGQGLLATIADVPLALLSIGWLAGCVLVLWRLLFAMLLLRRSARRCRALTPIRGGCAPEPADCCTPERTLLAAKDDAAVRLEITRSVQLLLDPRESIPLVWGLLHPRLRLPDGALKWSAEQQQSVLMHELAHVRRNDLVILTMTQFACALYWFNPLLWLASWRLHIECERACDDLVLGTGVRPSAYAEHLVELVSRLRPAAWTRACGLAMARRSSIENRLAAVLSAQINRRGVTRLLVAAVLVVGALVAIPLAMLRATEPSRPATLAAGENNVDKTVETPPENMTKLKASMEQKLQWGKPVNGLRAALVRPQALGQPAAAEHLDLKVLVQNVSDAPIRFNTISAAPKAAELICMEDGEILFELQDSKPFRTDFTIQPREVAVLRLFSARSEGRSITADHPPLTFTAELTVSNAPAGNWTGTLVTADTIALFSAYGLMPKSKDAQELFTTWNASARGNEMIPGGLIRLLAESVLTFTKLNPAWEKTPQLLKMLARFDAGRDWSGPDAVALLDELSAVQDSPIRMLLDKEIEGTIQKSAALPPGLANAPWGQPLANGLRLAWLLEPRAAAYPLGTLLKSRILIHNAGNTSVVFRTRTWHQADHKVTDARSADINVESVHWTTIGRLVLFRLGPGEFVEVNAAGVGVGVSKDDDDWANARVGSWVDAKEEDDVTVTPAAVPLRDRNENPQPGVEPHWWLDFITARLVRRLPLPADAEERTRLLYRIEMELFGTPLGEDETAAFVADREPGAIDALARRLARRAEVRPFSGSVQSAPTRFRVLAANPDAAKKPRIASTAGRYMLGGNTVLVVRRRSFEGRIANEASIQFFSDDPNQPPPGEPSQINLPDGYGTWAAAWERGGRVLWVRDQSDIRSYDFSTPAIVKAELAKPAKVPVAIREALHAALTEAVPNPAPITSPPPATLGP
jgi:beta-lactamase regulating signal transducer with metallopeptidase domain